MTDVTLQVNERKVKLQRKEHSPVMNVLHPVDEVESHSQGNMNKPMTDVTLQVNEQKAKLKLQKGKSTHQ